MKETRVKIMRRGSRNDRTKGKKISDFKGRH